jgi:hypothetical protein
MSSPVVVVDGKEYRFLAVTTVLSVQDDSPEAIHYIHVADSKTGELHSFESSKVSKILKVA